MSGEIKSLPFAEAAFAGAMARPRHVAFVGVAVLIAVGWLYLSAMASAAGIGGTFAALGPGMAVFDTLADRFGLERVAFPVLSSSGALAALMAVCAVHPAAWGVEEALLHFGMWLAMALAMMLPTAAPMLRTYSEIADTAAGQGRRVVSPLILAAGYIAVWSGFSVMATGLHWVLGSAGMIGNGATPANVAVAAVIVAGAGIYQFLPLKAACLVKCANPFPFLFANWTERATGVFRLGVRQGVYCLGCCWALMLVMFAVGVINLLWIAGLAAVMTAEKIVGRAWFSRAIGAVLLMWSAVLASGAAASFV